MEAPRLRLVGRQVAELVWLAANVSRLGSDLRSRAAIFALGLSLPLKRRHAGARSRAVRLRLRKLGTDFTFVVRDRADYVILSEVLVEEAYEVPEVEEPETILDLGSNVGASVVWFHLRYPAARIHAYEPSPAAFAQLQANAGGLEGVTLHRAAVGDCTTSLPFYVSDESLMSSLDPSVQGEATLVDVRRLDDIAGALPGDRIDLIKIDVEGAEYGALEAFGGLDRVGAVVGEIHVDLSGRSRDEFLALLDGFEVRVRQMALPDIPGADRWTFEAVHPERTGRTLH